MLMALQLSMAEINKQVSTLAICSWYLVCLKCGSLTGIFLGTCLKCLFGHFSVVLTEGQM